MINIITKIWLEYFIYEYEIIKNIEKNLKIKKSVL